MSLLAALVTVMCGKQDVRGVEWQSACPNAQQASTSHLTV